MGSTILSNRKRKRAPGPVRGMLCAMLMAAAFLSFARSDAAADGLAGWTVAEVKGAVFVQRGTSGWVRLAKGHLLPPGAKVRSGPDGRADLRSNGDSIAVSPGSEFQIPSGDRGARASGIQQTMGTLLFKVVTRPSKPFTVKTPYLAAVIKGTTFTVTVDAVGAALHVTKGLVQVQSIASGKTVMVRPGHTAVVSGGPAGALKLLNGAVPPRAGAGKATGAAASAGHGKSLEAIGNGRLDVPAASGGLVNDGDGQGPGSAGGNSANARTYGANGNGSAVPSVTNPLGFGGTTGPTAGGRPANVVTTTPPGPGAGQPGGVPSGPPAGGPPAGGPPAGGPPAGGPPAGGPPAGGPPGGRP